MNRLYMRSCSTVRFNLHEGIISTYLAYGGEMGRGLGQWGLQGGVIMIANDDAGQMSHPCFSGYLLHQARSNLYTGM